MPRGIAECHVTLMGGGATPNILIFQPNVSFIMRVPQFSYFRKAAKTAFLHSTIFREEKYCNLKQSCSGCFPKVSLSN